MTPAEFAQTINPRRHAPLRSRNGSATAICRYRPQYSNPKPLERTQNWLKVRAKQMVVQRNSSLTAKPRVYRHGPHYAIGSYATWLFGNRISTAKPLPLLLAIMASPPCARATAFTFASPRPLPPA